MSLKPYSVAQDMQYESDIAAKKQKRSKRKWSKLRQQLASYPKNLHCTRQQVAQLKQQFESTTAF